MEKQIKVIIDTGVVISAAKGGKSDSDLIHHLLKDQLFMVLISQEILSEYNIVLHRAKLKIPEEAASYWLEQFNNLSREIHPETYTKFNRDRKDAKFVNLAIHTGADYIISLDNDLLKADLPKGIKCLKPKEFEKIIQPGAGN